jgi:hypothetical protein
VRSLIMGAGAVLDGASNCFANDGAVVVRGVAWRRVEERDTRRTKVA